jgi:DNA-binding transcriptional LysR family regulator
MNLTTRQLKAFVVVARLGSFTRAAEQIHMTQAGLSSMIREIEDQLDCRLFERTTRTVALTPAGRSLLPVVQRVLAELEDAARNAVILTRDADRTLSIAATPLVCASLLPDVVASLRRTKPDLSITVRDVDRGAIESMVENSEVDVGLGIFPEEKSSLLRQVLCAVDLILVTPPTQGTPSVTSSSAPWDALEGEPMLALPADNALQAFVDERLQGLNINVQARFRHLHTLIGMVEAGCGQAVLPSFAASTCNRYRVQVRPMTAADPRLDFCAITRRGARPSGALEPFLEIVRTRLRLTQLTANSTSEVNRGRK